VVDVVVRERRLRWPIAAGVEAAIRGHTVRGIERRAKYILIRFDGGTLILHLGMSGSLRLVKADTGVPIREPAQQLGPQQGLVGGRIEYSEIVADPVHLREIDAHCGEG